LIARSLEHPRQVELAGTGPQGSWSEADTRPGKNTEPTRSHPTSGIPVTLQGSRCSRPRRRPCRQRQARHATAEGD